MDFQYQVSVVLIAKSPAGDFEKKILINKEFIHRDAHPTHYAKNCITEKSATKFK